MLDAGHFVQIVERRQGLKIGCIEEVAWRMGYINETELAGLAENLLKSGYGEYLLRIISENPSLS